jgi:hypothetical protein
LKAFLAGGFALALGAASAAAAGPTPAPSAPAAPAATAAPPAPSAAALAYGATILNDVGMKPSLDRIVPGMLAELQREVLSTRPELKEPLAAAVEKVEPEFLKSEEEILSSSAKFLGETMTEDELKQVAAFYESPLGKKFEGVQTELAARIATVAASWRQQLSTVMLARVHEEMKKSGHDF